jgi:CorA-like Mg2+ transporter protein
MPVSSLRHHNSNKTYVSKIHDLAPSTNDLQALVNVLSKPDAKTTKVFYSNLDSQPHINTPSDLIASARADWESGTRAVCVIENISPEYIEALGSAWNLDPEFFAGHATNPRREDLWKRWQPPPGDPAAENSRRYEHLDGVFEYPDIRVTPHESLDSSPNYFHRHCFREPTYGVQSNTRISYYHVNRVLCKSTNDRQKTIANNALSDLFLVDAPLNIGRKYVGMHRRSRPTLRLPYAMNRGGLQLPQLFDQAQYSILDSLKSVFQHGWHLELLLSNDLSVFARHPLLYVLSNSLWQSNLRFLAEDIKRISFEEIRYPNYNINEVLHDRREDLAFIKSGLTETTTYVPDKVREYFRTHPYYSQRKDHVLPLTPVDRHQRTLEEAARLEVFLMQTFQLLMSSISVQESHLSSEQAKRATRLTQLAFIYIPLSFVTGIFGMNLKELNGSGLPIWALFVAMAIVVILTAVIFWLPNARAVQRHSQNERKSSVV